MLRFASRFLPCCLLIFFIACSGEKTFEKIPSEPALTQEKPAEEIAIKEDASSVEPADEVSIIVDEEDPLPPVEPIKTERKAKPKVQKPKYSKIAFEHTTYDFEELTSGDKTDHKFTFVNEGDAPLEIKNVHVSCGCTIPSYPFLPINPGEEGYIGVAYNSVGKEGFQRATIRVITNDPRRKEVVLNIEGTVQKEEKSESKDTSSIGQE